MNINTNADVDLLCEPNCQKIGGSKYKATFSIVTGQGAATHMLVTDSVPSPALYSIKLWGFNDIDMQTGAGSDASPPAATFGGCSVSESGLPSAAAVCVLC